MVVVGAGSTPVVTLPGSAAQVQSGDTCLPSASQMFKVDPPALSAASASLDTDPLLYGAWRHGFVTFPPAALKDYESVGECTQVVVALFVNFCFCLVLLISSFAFLKLILSLIFLKVFHVTEGQRGALEVGIALPSDDPQYLPQRYLLSPGIYF